MDLIRGIAYLLGLGLRWVVLVGAAMLMAVGGVCAACLLVAPWVTSHLPTALWRFLTLGIVVGAVAVYLWHTYVERLWGSDDRYRPFLHWPHLPQPRHRRAP